MYVFKTTLPRKRLELSLEIQVEKSFWWYLSMMEQVMF